MQTEPSDSRFFTTPPGGVMTDEVGAITGPVELWIDGETIVVRYAGALDRYTVGTDAHERDIDDIVRELTTDPGVDDDGNPRAVSLSGKDDRKP